MTALTLTAYGWTLNSSAVTIAAFQGQLDSRRACPLVPPPTTNDLAQTSPTLCYKELRVLLQQLCRPLLAHRLDHERRYV